MAKNLCFAIWKRGKDGRFAPILDLPLLIRQTGHVRSKLCPVWIMETAKQYQHAVIPRCTYTLSVSVNIIGTQCMMLKRVRFVSVVDSSVASPTCQEGQKWKNLPNFPSLSWFFPFFLILGKVLVVRGGTLLPLDTRSYWLWIYSTLQSM